MRWQGVLFLLVLTAIVVLAGMLFSDRWIENTLEDNGSLVIGALVEIDDFELSLTDVQVRWGRLQITDPGNTMKNIIETDTCILDLEFWPVLSKKIIIEDFTVSGLRTGTDREYDGRLETEEKAKRDEFISGTIDQLEESVAGESKANFKAVKKKVNTDSILQLLDLQSVTRIQNLEQKVKTTYNGLNLRLVGLDYDQRLQEIEQKIKAVDLNRIKDVDGFRKALGSVDDIRKSISMVSKEFNQTRKEVQSQIGSINQQLGQVDDWIARDYQKAIAMARLPEVNTESIGRLLFGDDIVSRLTGYLGYVQTARSYSQSLEPETPEAEDPPRLKGQDIYFYSPNARPDFWIKNVHLSGFTADGLKISGTASDIVSDQRLIGKPTEFRIGSDKGSAISLAFSGLLDYQLPEAAETFELSYTGFSLNGTQIGNSSLLPNQIERGTGSVSAKLNLQGEQITGKLDFRGSQLTFAPPAKPASGEAEKIVQSIIKGISTVTAAATITGDSSGLDFDVKTNLGDIFVSRMKALISGEIEEAKKKIRKEIDQKVEVYRDQLNQLVSGQEKQISGTLGKYEDMISKKTKLADDKKKEIDERIKKEQSKLKDKLKDIIKF